MKQPENPKYPWKKDIKKPEDFPDKFQGLAIEIGVSQTLQVMRHFEDENMYFNKIKDAFRPFWHREIRRKWRKRNLKILAHEFQVSEQAIRNIVNDPESQ